MDIYVFLDFYNYLLMVKISLQQEPFLGEGELRLAFVFCFMDGELLSAVQCCAFNE